MRYPKENLVIKPVATALARTVKALSSSTLITLNSETRLVRVYAIAKDVYLHWATSDEDYAKSSNFDEVIIAGQAINLQVPYQTDGAKFSRIQVVGRESGATVIVIEK